jgi:carbon storage regulator
MLIIARRKGDRIKIGDDIELVVTDVSRAGVRLGIVAPANVAIVRGEMQSAAEEANRDAARSHLTVLSAEKPAVGDAVVINPVDFMRESRSSKIDDTRSRVTDGQDAPRGIER